MKNSVRAIIIIVLCLWIGTGNLIKATELDTTDEELIEINEELVEANEDEIIEIVSEKNIETNFSSKEYKIEGDNKSNYLLEGGNENAINTLATEQNSAQATLVENVNVQGKPYDMSILDDEAYDSKNDLELRQFVSFETKSGKVFHLIIDHSKDGDNVMMLTEVGEQDLLNMIEEQADVEFELSDNEIEIDEEVIEEKQKTIDASENAAVSEEESKKEIDKDLVIIIAVAVIGGIGGWYFKIYKPKREALYDDEVDEADYLEDDDYLEDTEHLDEDE